MDASSFRSESHIAQQSRRDKLRVQSSSSVQHLDDFPNNLEHLPVHSELTPDLVQVRNDRNGSNIFYEPITTVFPSAEMLHFASSSNVLPAQRDHHHHAMLIGQEQPQPQPSRPIPGESTSFTNMSHHSHPISSNFNASPKANTSDPQGCSSNWRNIDSHQSYDWMVNYHASGSSSSVGRESNQKPMFVGDVLSNSARANNISTSTLYLKTSYNGFQDGHQASLANQSSEMPGQHSQKQYREMQIATSHIHPSFYQNSLQDVVTPDSIGGNSERILLPTYGNQSTALFFDNANAWMNRPVENCHQWSSELGIITRKTDQELRPIANDHNTQGLSLSLSSNPPSRGNVTQFGEGYESEYFQSKSGIFKEPHQDSKLVRPNYSCAMSKPAIVSRSSGKSLNEMVGTSNYALRNPGPLGPFTGYATILKSSRFLKPAQELLDEFCDATGLKLMRPGEGSGRTSAEVNSLASLDVVISTADAETAVKGNNNSGVSSSTFYSSNEVSGDMGVASSSCESYRPEYQQRKAKLLYLQEEVSRRYKQYHQQMQMVASSFEAVAGLSAATPYVSLALRTVSRNFRFLKLAISDQLKYVCKALGEDLLSPNSGASSSKGDTSTPRTRYRDQSFHRHKSGGANVGIFEPQQHVWRPQRGLPERSVAILRAWLFEHFLHPYPTDTDKHMLATQTGLSRNQVSNWFINARVRVWKPMVEEIHMLETKGLAETNRSASNNDGKSKEGTSQPNHEQALNNLGASSMLNKQQLECSGSGSSAGSGEQQLQTGQWSQDKRSRLDQFQVPSNMDGSMMNFLPYQRSGIDIGAGLGAVSLTLGLRHGVENVQQQQQQHQHPEVQQHEDQLRRQFGGQMIHDFVG
ncbi:BEL1-like homeodomain protein 4 [Ricinus communis]|uniref:Bel1 homeotic protein, putative n=1 Tax=Ricinus communis TaxID=3988 RepID=B9STV7_RICCO|nr:BEL1-like homeodomain protein 4 [Ricinus communis]XP_048234710.1 BEL1-like homeodomain protein 4 [Ricinus communis]EEF32952.1 bel1 homeotic protein, putative [Ricinus communis]|eukprot:XP_002529426.1 BEL1-like homeodomain protein 4 [Ricinus communis]